MKISAIKAQVKNPDRVSVFIDGKYSFSLTLDQLLREKLKKDLLIDSQEVKRFKKLSEEGKLKSKTLEWLLRRPHSTRELQDYLFKHKVEKDFADALVEEFKSKNYLNDAEFAKWFAENRIRKNKSKREIESELRSKGISTVTIQHTINDLSIKENDTEALRVLINKLRNKPRYSDDKRLIKYLISKGFLYSEIKDAIRNHQA